MRAKWRKREEGLNWRRIEMHSWQQWRKREEGLNCRRIEKHSWQQWQKREEGLNCRRIEMRSWRKREEGLNCRRMEMDSWEESRTMEMHIGRGLDHPRGARGRNLGLGRSACDAKGGLGGKDEYRMGDQTARKTDWGRGCERVASFLKRERGNVMQRPGVKV
jgi:hypothetical protein